MAVPRGLLRGYGDRREEASFASKSVDNIKNKKNLTKKYGKWLKIGLATGQAYAICLICRLVQKLTTNERMANLFAIVMLAYVWCYIVGIYIHENIKKMKVLHRGRRSKSLFKYGLEYIAQCLLNYTNRYLIDIPKFLSYT